jgi:hypothetical protein
MYATYTYYPRNFKVIDLSQFLSNENFEDVFRLLRFYSIYLQLYIIPGPLGDEIQ